MSIRMHLVHVINWLLIKIMRGVINFKTIWTVQECVSVTVYQPTRYNAPEHLNVRQHRCEKHWCRSFFVVSKARTAVAQKSRALGTRRTKCFPVAPNVCGPSVRELASCCRSGAYNSEISTRRLENLCIPGLQPVHTWRRQSYCLRGSPNRHVLLTDCCTSFNVPWPSCISSVPTERMLLRLHSLKPKMR
jgi:hypothetical protein